MMRETRPLMRPLSLFQKQNPIYAKLVLFLLFGVTIFLYSSRSIDYSTPPLQNPTSFVSSNSTENDVLITSHAKDLETQPSSEFDLQESEIEPLIVDEGSPSTSSSNEVHIDEAKPDDEAKPEDEAKPNDEAKPKCNLFKGEWVPNPKGPAYNNFTCNYIESTQNCLTNGRPDTGYLYWRWKPRDCELPKFDPERFLNFMRNKTFAFIGDSINRNHVQSLLCILSQVDEPKIIYRDEQFKSMTFFFPSYNFTLARVWAPFLLKAETFEDSDGVSSGDIQLDLDKLEENWTKQYKDFDYVIIGGGQWFFKRTIYHENNQVQGCHYCPGKNLTELGFDYAYRKAINRVLTFITSSNPKTQVLFRTFTPSHFENGKWDDGGNCKRKVPFKGNEINITETNRILYDIEMQEFDKASSVASKKGITLKLFDSTQLSLLRPDGHPGPYRDYQPFAKDKNAKVQNDCLHWCLPGPIDTWNELVLETLMNG
ncbi:protein trichome birefringence-like 26 [Silene latifolia]|uniref:protein trichome birefringence-like 26 n=1 Tax=Silene latifolia TaxID=37657 RepID=UPI003D788B74